MEELHNLLTSNIKYNTFSQEVEVLSSTKVGENYYYYTVKNKNGVVYRHVPGIAGIQQRGIMGFVSGDRSRPVMTGPSFNKQVVTSEFTYEGYRAYFGGGSTGSAVLKIEYVYFFTSGSAQDFADLSVARSDLSGAATKTRGVWVGGSSGDDRKLIDYIVFAAPATAVLFGYLTKLGLGRAACADAVSGRCLVSGGFGDGSLHGYINEIEYFDINTLGDAASFGVLTRNRYGLTAVNSQTRALFVGGASIVDNGAYAYETDIIDYVTIATLGNAIDFGDLTLARQYLRGCTDGNRAVFAGGHRQYSEGGAKQNIIDYVTIATLADAQDFGDLAVQKYAVGATASGDRGLFAGGNKGAGDMVSVVEKIAISTTADSTNFGNLSEAKSGMGALTGS